MSRKRRESVRGWKNARRLRERKPRYLVVSGGAVTEKWYFKALASLCDVVIDYEQKNLSPSQLAKLACRLKEDADRDGSVDSYVKVWVVVDVDAFHDHSEAERICRGHDGVELIISNPCFEVWLLDHKRACPQSCTQTAMVEKLAIAEGVTEGNRGKFICAEILDETHIMSAVGNARRHNKVGGLEGRRLLRPNHEQDYAPWTDMPSVINELGKYFKNTADGSQSQR
ncbi:RloB domain-containing protein [Bifidobacterium sp. 64T4]|uniref:RloB family protein n=1 Tax=Bifidobacterium pongonis TaxID=2834432 RepID=UPI001C597613|nr:RloB family protein [Bifidobacterium pongonis]MBW3094246.1 RloB domain-containing protein [Bifidobacterium pongonis]